MNKTFNNRVRTFIGEAAPKKGFNTTLQGAVLGTSIGSRNENQDRCIVAEVKYGISGKRDFSAYVICDGMGGMQAGGEAATLGASAFLTSLIETCFQPDIPRLRAAAIAANFAIFSNLKGAGGSTLAAVFQTVNDVYVVHAGDSRIYSLNSTGEASQLTIDDTLGQYLKHNLHQPNSGLAGREGQLVQFLGMGEDFEPHISRVIPQSKTKLVVTSDGIHAIAPDAFSLILKSSKLASELTRKLLQLSDITGGLDNATVIILDSEALSPAIESSAATIRLYSTVQSLELWQSIDVTPSLADTTQMRAVALQPKARKRKPPSISKTGITANTRKQKSDKPKAEKDEGNFVLNIQFPEDQ